MRHTELSFPELGLVAATRGILGTGIGLLLADRFSNTARRAVGWTMLSIGALSTIPLAMEVFGHRPRGTSANDHDTRTSQDRHRAKSSRRNQESVPA